MLRAGACEAAPLDAFEDPERSLTRCRVACDACGFEAWIGPDGAIRDAWCEACQASAKIPATKDEVRCDRCGEPFASVPRFEELWGEFQNLVAVLEAWQGDVRRLTPLVPERPRYLTDLHPPRSAPEDPPELHQALEALRAGSFGVARETLEEMLECSGTLADRAIGSEPATRGALALGIARHRMGVALAAEAAYTRVLEADSEHPQARLDRAAVRASRRDFGGALEDLERCGDGPEVRWNRAALLVDEAVASGPDRPDPDRLREARAWAGPPSAYWSDATVGRLLFALLAERAALGGGGAVAETQAEALRQAERELEFDTFTDRAMLLATYARLSLVRDAARIARPLAQAAVAEIRAQPFVRGKLGGTVAAALEAVTRAIEAGRPGDAVGTARELLDVRGLARYRILCAACGQGTIGVECFEDEPASPEVPILESESAAWNIRRR